MKEFKTRNDLFVNLPKKMIICEIGVFKAEFSKFIYENCIPEELHLIDIFEGNMCSGDKDGNNMVEINLNDEYSNIVNHFKNDKNVFIHKGKSNDILFNFKDEYFDLIYIDGDHSYDAVKNDLDLSYNKVKKNGFICGHDYTNYMFPDIVRAVNEFCEKNNLKINYLTKDGCPSFCIKKIK